MQYYIKNHQSRFQLLLAYLMIILETHIAKSIVIAWYTILNYFRNTDTILKEVLAILAIAMLEAYCKINNIGRYIVKVARLIAVLFFASFFLITTF